MIQWAQDEWDYTVEWTGNLLGYLNPASDDFVLKKAFIPEEDPLEEYMDTLKNTVSEKLGFTSWVDLVGNLQGIQGSSESYNDTISVYGIGLVNADFVDLSFYDANKNMVYTVIRGVLAILLVIYNINQIYKLLNRGGTLAEGAGAIGHKDNDRSTAG